MDQYHVYVRPNYQGSSNTHTSHNYNTFVYYKAAHPHYNCYKCSCGEIKANKKEPNFLQSCSDCMKLTNISTGTYGLKNNGTGLYASVSYATDKQGQNIDTYKEICPFEIKTSGTKGHIIHPTLSSGRVMNVYTSEHVTSGNNVCLWDYTAHDSQHWYFQKVSGGYIIRSVQNGNCVLDIKDNWDVYVSTYTGAKTQIWTVENSITYNANGGSGAPKKQTKNYGDSIKLSTTKPTREGYSFAGWATKSSATTATYQSGASYTSNKDVVLYAVWNKDCNHTYSNPCDTSCNLCGKARSTSHSYSAATCKAPKTCKLCGKTSGSKLSHKYDSGKVTKKATCKKTGTKTYTCTGCKKTKAETIAKLKHSYKNYVCKTCGKWDKNSIKKTEKVDNKEYYVILDDAAIQTGPYGKCKTVKRLSEGDEIIVTERLYNAWDNKWFKCSDGYIYSENIKKHDKCSWGKSKVTKKATCTKTGKEEKKCTVCGKKKTSTIAKAKHKYKGNICKTCGKWDKSSIKKTEKVKNKKYYVISKDAAVHSAPYSRSETIDYLKKGETIVVTQRLYNSAGSKWFKFSGGYIYSKHIKRK